MKKKPKKKTEGKASLIPKDRGGASGSENLCKYIGLP